jgi:hypothetical protein
MGDLGKQDTKIATRVGEYDDMEIPVSPRE